MKGLSTEAYDNVHSAILRYIADGFWHSKGHIRRQFQAEGYEIDPINNDWLSNVLTHMVLTTHELRVRGRAIEYDDGEVLTTISEYRLSPKEK